MATRVMVRGLQSSVAHPFLSELRTGDWFLHGGEPYILLVDPAKYAGYFLQVLRLEQCTEGVTRLARDADVRRCETVELVMTLKGVPIPTRGGGG